MQLGSDVKTFLEDVFSFLKELDSVGLKPNLRIQGNTLKVKLEELLGFSGSGSIASGSVPGDDNEELYDEACVESPPAPSVPKPRSGSLPAVSPSPSNESGIAEVSAASITKDATIQGFLEKKRPDGKLFGNLFQKRFCVIHNGIFYYFDKESDKKQKGAFTLKDYEARPAAAKIKKDGAFELVALAQRCYQFTAKDFETMKQWIIAVSEWSNVPHPPIDSLTKPSGDKAQASSAGSDAGSITAGSITGVDSVIEEEIYDDGVEAPVGLNKKLPPTPVNDGEDTYHDGGETLPPPAAPEELYDEGGAEQEIYAEPSGGEETQEDIYDEGEEAPPTPGKANLNRPLPAVLPNRPLPAVLPPTPKRALPPPPDRPVISARFDDYANQFYALCDCEADLAHELSFKEGDVLHVVQREHEEKGWWTALLNSKVGLVPVSYLTPAFTAC